MITGVHNRFVETIRGKIIVIFALLLCSLALIWFVNRIAFKRITTIVNELSLPNQKLLLSRKLFIDVSNLTHLQRMEVMEGKSKPSGLFLVESRRIRKNADTLKRLLAAEPGQVKRIDSITTLMRQGNKLFLEHLKLRYEITSKKEFENQLHALSEKMDNGKLQVDTNIITSEKKIKITTVMPADSVVQTRQKKSWIKKLFSKRSKDTLIHAQPQVIIEEEINTTVDTLSVAKLDNNIAEIGSSLKKIGYTRSKKNDLLKKSEQQLLQSNEVLLNQLLNILSEVEKEETAQVKEKTSSTVLLADDTINLTRAITILLILTALALGILILVDITRSRTYRRQLEIAKNEAEYHSLAKQRFLANMSHEIRTPLQSILGYSELELNRRKSGDENIEAIHASARHLLQIVNEVLDYSRIISGKFNFESKVFSVNDIVAEVVSVMQLQAEKKSLKLHADTTGINSAENVKGDAFRLKQVLFNLLGNALKFTEKGMVKLMVQQNRQGDRVEYAFIISDTGIGMKEKDIAIIFNQFEQAENAGSLKNGTGLGLSIVKELVEAQQGSISVQSTPGKGSEFRVTLSFLHSDEILPLPNVKSVSPVSFTGKVWVVDDDPLILRLSVLILQKHHITYSVFDSAEKLLALPWDDTVQIVFTDLRLTGTSGVELCRALRKKIPAAVKIIAMTAQVLPGEKDALFKDGFDGLIMKPFTELTFIEMLLPQNRSVINSPGIDLDKLKKMIGDEGEVCAVLKQCYDDTTNDVKELSHSLKHFDPGKTSLIIHRLAGRIGQMGNKKLAAQLRGSEIAARAMSTREGLKKETEILIPALTVFLKSLQKEFTTMEVK